MLLVACGDATCDCAGPNPDLIVAFGDPLPDAASVRVCLIQGPCAVTEIREDSNDAWFSFDYDDLDGDLESYFGTVSMEVLADDGSRLAIGAVVAMPTESCCGDHWLVDAGS